jgi:hypothetical protein
MSSPNRARYTVTLGGPWRLYTTTCPPGSQMLGTIQRGMEIGALAKSPIGVYTQINAGAMRPLDQDKVRRALAPTPHKEIKHGNLHLRQPGDTGT